ncbi:MAG: hypothetical protein ACFFCZ_20235 [Promethearchaeota archaeon]
MSAILRKEHVFDSILEEEKERLEELKQRVKHETDLDPQDAHWVALIRFFDPSYET